MTLILGKDDHFFRVRHGYGTWCSRTGLILTLAEAEDRAMTIINELHKREKDRPQWVMVEKDDKETLRHWTKLEGAIWKEWAVNGKA